MTRTRFFREKPVGETYVWFTSLGLAAGLTMVATLLALIFINGISVFWPQPVAVIELKSESSAASNGSRYIGGRIVKKQEKPVKLVHAKGEQTEWQLYIGNKDVYGLAFRFIDTSEFQRIGYPDNIISIERMEYGDAIGYPESLEIKERGKITTRNSGFNYWLGRLVSEAGRRRNEIEKIEKKQIGAINYEMEKLQVKKRALERQRASSSELKSLQDQMDNLQKRYEGLAGQASRLRARQNENFLNYMLVSGEKKRLALGQVVSFYYPNRMNILEKMELFFMNLWKFVSQNPRESNTEGGIFPAIFGTFVMTLLLSLTVTPFGVLAAIYLREYARQGIFVRSVRIAVNNLAGVPSIVFGVFGLGFFVYLLGGTIDQLFFRDYLPSPTFGTGGILWASLTLALMTVPVVIVATEEALAATPRGMREASLACGASKWQTIQRVVLPASSQGILTGLILAMARGAGEVAPLMLVGVVKLAPSLPLDGTYPYIHLDQKFMHLGFHIYDLGFQSPDSEAAKPMVFATTLLLISLVVILNLGAIIIRERLRRKYSTGAF